jgi:hypothetical protein
LHFPDGEIKCISAMHIHMHIHSWDSSALMDQVLYYFFPPNVEPIPAISSLHLLEEPISGAHTLNPGEANMSYSLLGMDSGEPISKSKNA